MLQYLQLTLLEGLGTPTDVLLEGLGTPTDVLLEVRRLGPPLSVRCLAQT